MFYRKTKEEVLQELRSDASGLTHAEASARLQQEGRNELVAAKNDSAFVIFLKQFQDLLVLILIAAAIISFISGETSSTLVILVVITLNAILGTVQTLQAQKTLDSLKQLSAPKTKVIREGHRVEVDVRDICVGDLLVLEAGDIVAADGRIIESFGLQINESSLTGEPLGVDKTVDVIEEECVLAEQKNMVFSSGLVANGRAVAVVTAIGMATEIGKIATLMNQTKERKTPLQRNLDDFSKKLSLVIILISIAVFGLNWINTKDVLDSLMFAVALAVAAIPEALSSIVTIVLALGTKKMAEQNAIIKNLNSVESLGSVSIICSDKTGTLTQNKMSVTDVIVTGNHYTANDFTIQSDNQKLIMMASFLCNDATINHGKRIGDPTELAFLDFADKKDMSHSLGRQHYSRLSELPFDSDRKLMSTLNEIEGHHLMLVKGATDELLQRCDRILCDETICEIQEEDRIQQLEAASLYSSEGKRVLGFAFKEHRNEPLKMSDESNLVFIGMIVMEDPPREESKLAIEKCGIAGIKPIMITGDHKTTAVAIARSIGLYHEGDQVVDGLELNAMSDEELKARIPYISVYARVAPEHKIRIVDMWQKLGQIVAMTGDGVNDAPALKRSDIGIAMGITGTEVSKDAASMVLTDDNFATIVNAIITGRNVYANIRNSISYLLSGNLSGILCVLF
ncbi:MAG: cation-translocating P-type ATPase, partial [Erysipelotrichaceae bacterium]